MVCEVVCEVVVVRRDTSVREVVVLGRGDGRSAVDKSDDGSERQRAQIIRIFFTVGRRDKSQETRRICEQRAG